MITRRRVTVSRIAVGLASAALSACGARALATPRTELRSLQLRATSGNFGNDFVFVEPVDTGVLIRAVRVDNANDLCPSTVVEAVERVIPATTVQALAGTPICAMTDARIDAAQRRAVYRGGTVDFLGSVEEAIAQCGGEDRGVHQDDASDHRQ